MAVDLVTVFVPNAPGSAKVKCPVCERSGYGPARPRHVFEASPWQRACLQNPDHPFHCSCGKRYSSKSAAAAHIRGMRRHHPDETHIRLDGDLPAEIRSAP